MTKTILFDVDGVLLSEERYFDSSALTVWELLHSDQYIGIRPDIFKTNVTMEEIKEIRSTYFDDDRVLSFIKARGINANWDMVYLTSAYQIIVLLEQIMEEEGAFVQSFLQADINQRALLQLNQKLQNKVIELQLTSFVDDFQKGNATKGEMLPYLNRIAYEKLGVETDVFARNSSLWELCRETFQEWYVGDDMVEASTGKPTKQPGKEGFMQFEQPLADVNKIQHLFEQLNNQGFRVGIGTGRPKLETMEPLRALGLLPFIDEKRIATASDVLVAEQQCPDQAPLAKPQPYTYVLAWLGNDQPVEKVLNQSLPLVGEEIVIVGDSVADGLAAQTMGVTFVAVLTGLSGKKARPSFEEMGADYIIDNVIDIANIRFE
ncbi:HAD family hydrolase [Pontibacillus litoralis]|uniref:Haloacid dehalogenase n=1 Tax=Pontibacillus litoralis JSM 072002 TaxID=1385512 RepID=A0A0A5HMP7_9BACI|nr:HAD family hydrolase [Pontibacillus litoralis]KGX84892.1 haloacid dehalogenase [Pontibacillus litoralis JSM 072002]